MTLLTLLVGYGLTDFIRLSDRGGALPQLTSGYAVEEAQDDGIIETADAITITGSNLVRSIDVKGQAVIVVGHNNILHLTGSSASLTVTGNHNEIEVENAKAIIVNGGGNQINYSGSEPLIQEDGSDQLEPETPC
jgi:hypothetical protein